ncbi:MAG: hypothetical protein ACUVRO_05720 [Armatimonadota bacterium]
MSSASTIRLFGLASVSVPITKDRLLQLFVAGNFLFLSVDVGLAHSVNSFTPVYELIPVVYSPLAGIMSLYVALRQQLTTAALVLHAAAMLTGVVVGFMGSAFHFNAVVGPGGQLSWQWVIFGSPVLGPLAFAGIGLIGLLAALREDPADSGRMMLGRLLLLQAPISRQRQLYWLVGLGFAGALGTSVLEHAQGGYTPVYEWIPILMGTYATSMVILFALSSEHSPADQTAYFWTMLASILVGVMGFTFHLSADLAGAGGVILERFLTHAPIFAPLLFADLGVLGLLVALREEDI